MFLSLSGGLPGTAQEGCQMQENELMGPLVCLRVFDTSMLGIDREFIFQISIKNEASARFVAPMEV